MPSIFTLQIILFVQVDLIFNIIPYIIFLHNLFIHFVSVSFKLFPNFHPSYSVKSTMVFIKKKKHNNISDLGNQTNIQEELKAELKPAIESLLELLLLL